jgi:hypothetical protein
MDVKMVVFGCPQVACQFQTAIQFTAVNYGLIMEHEVEKALI